MIIYYLKGADILQLGDDLVSCPLPVLGGSFDLLKHSARVLQLISDMSPSSNISLAFHPREIGIGSQPISLHHRHSAKEEAWRLGKPVVDIEESRGVYSSLYQYIHISVNTLLRRVEFGIWLKHHRKI